MTKLVVSMRTQLTSHHGARLSMQLGKMVHAKERRIVDMSSVSETKRQSGIRNEGIRQQ
jgi:hypothetical protein